MLRWLERIALALVAIVAIAIIAALVFLHTPRGRELERHEIEAQLAGKFTGGGTVGRVLGTPLGELIVQHVTINGPDKRPAITIGELRVRAHLIDLIHKDVSLGELVASDVDVELGTDTLARLMKPSTPSGPSAWSVDLDRVSLRRVHVHVDTGTARYGVVDLDALALDGDAHVRASGTKSGSVKLAATWRQKRAPIAIAATVRDDAEQTAAPAVDVAIGAVSLAVRDLQLVKHGTRVSGSVKLAAPRAEVARLTGVELPDDVTLAAAASRDGRIGIDGTLGPTPVHAQLTADLAAKHAAGTVVTGDFDLARLSRGAIRATAGAVLDFDAAPGKAGELPIARATVHAHGTYEHLPRTELVIALDSNARHANATIDVTGAATAHLAAALTRDGNAYRLDRARLTAHAKNLPRLRGALDVAFAAHGPLWPAPALTVAGSVRGTKLVAAGASASDLELALDATGLPRQPRGTVHVHAFDLVKGATRYGTLVIDATSRRDGWLDVTASSKAPRWLVELAARVKPPGAGHTTEIDVVRHRVRTSGGADWSGRAGRISIDPDAITVRGLTSASASGRIAIDATYGRRSGDVRATIDASKLALATLEHGYAGALDAHVAVQRTRGVIAGQLAIDGTGIALRPEVTPLALHVEGDAKPGRVALGIDVSGPRLGTGTVDVELAAPRNLADVAAWRSRGRDAIRRARIALANVDLGKLAQTLGAANAQLSGTADGALELTATGAGGTIALRGLRSPSLEGLGAIDGTVTLAQPSPDVIAPAVTIVATQLGRVDADVAIQLPRAPFDAAAWRALGTRALRRASLRTTNLAFDPSVLERFGVHGMLRGHATATIDVAAALASVQATIDVPDLRGAPLAKPVHVSLDAGIDDKAATATLAMQSDHQQSILRAKLDVPVSLATLRADPKAVEALPLAGRIDIPQTSAPQLLGAFGRTELVAGTLSGTIDVAGTVGKPTAKVHLQADGLQVPPGPGGRPIEEVKRLAIDASWNGKDATLAIAGVEAGGTLSLDAHVAPADLAGGSATIVARSFDLVPLLAFAPGPAGGAAGTLDGKIVITSFDPRTARIGGALRVEHARAPIAPAVGTLRDATLDIRIEPHDIALTGDGKLGQGTVHLAGAIALDRLAPSGGRATITLKHVSPIASVQPLIDATIAAKLARTGGGWQADVTVDHGFIKLDKTSGEKLRPVGAPPDLKFTAKDTGAAPRAKPGAPVPPGATAKPKRAMFVANITIKPIPIESEQVRTTVRGNLRAVADLQGLDLEGTIETLGGNVMLFDRRYRIEQAQVRFDGSTDPVIAVDIAYEFPDVTLDAKVHGRASKPKLQLSSNPGIYTQTQLLGFLLGGEPGGDTRSSSFSDTATSSAESLVGAQLGKYVKNAVPGIKIDVLKYNAATANNSEAIEAGTWITHSLFFQFTAHPEARPDENDEEGTLEYWITHHLELQVTAGDRNYDGIDILWHRRY